MSNNMFTQSLRDPQVLGKGYTELDLRYLKLDASNDPLTGQLVITPTSVPTTAYGDGTVGAALEYAPLLATVAELADTSASIRTTGIVNRITFTNSLNNSPRGFLNSTVIAATNLQAVSALTNNTLYGFMYSPKTMSLFQGQRMRFLLNNATGNVTTSINLDMQQSTVTAGYIGTMENIRLQTAGGGIGTQIGMEVMNQGATNMVNSYGLYMIAQSSSVNPYTIYSLGGRSHHTGNFGFGASNIYPVKPIDTTGAIIADRTTLGSEIVTNGTFTGSATGWTLGASWAYNSNNVIKNADGTDTLSQTVPISIGAIYVLTFTISGWAGPIRSIDYTPTATGSGYTVGDTLTISGGTGGTATVAVVNGSGGVTGLTFTAAGSGYTTGVGKATTGGTGTGCTVNIIAVTTQTVTPSMGGVTGYAVSGNGTYTQTFIPTSTADLVFTPTSASRFIIDTVTVKANTGGNLNIGGNLLFNGSSKIIGGGDTTSDLTLQTTSGVGAAGADMHFLVGNNGATEAMTILNSGNVGIGTSAPNAKLTVFSSVAGSQMELRNPDGNASYFTTTDLSTGATSSNGCLFGYNNGGLFFNRENTDSIIGTNDTTRIRVKNTGLVILSSATTSTTAKLHVDTESTTTIGAIIRGTAAQSASLQEWQDNSGTPLTYIEADGDIVVDTDSQGLKLGADQDILLSSNGAGILNLTPAADTDITINHIGTTNSGVYKWMEDEDYFEFDDNIYPQQRLLLPMGEISYFSTTGTAITITTVSDGSTNMVVCNPTTALTSGGLEFDNGGSNNGRLRYTGATTKMFHVACTISVAPASANDDFVFGIAKGGTVVAASKVLLQAINASQYRSTALHAMVELATNEYIELYVGNITDADDVAIHSLNLFAMGM